MNEAIRVQALTRRFGDFTAVDGIDFTVRRGAIFGFLGPNGSGKTVTIKMLTGLMPISAGQAWVDGIDVKSDPDGVRQRIGYMSQKFGLYDDLTVAENLRFYGKAYGLDKYLLSRRLDEAIERNALQPYHDRLAGRLSGGWKQRLALACAMLHTPRILYLDEPTAGIDPVARRQLWDFLFELSGQGITLFVTTHYMDEAERCSDLAYLYYGRLIATGTPDELRAREDITPPGFQRYEIISDEPSLLLQAIRKVSGISSATLFGRSIHVLAENMADPAQFIDVLHQHAIVAREARPLAVTLEDVFVELTHRRQRELEHPQ